MKFAVLLGVIALLPVAAVAGYFAHQEPPLPAFGQYAIQELGVRHIPGQDSDDWMAVAVTGPHKGGAMDAAQALVFFPNQATLEQNAQGKVKFYEVRCQNFSSGTDKNLLFAARSVIHKCSSAQKTRKQVERHLNGQLQG